MTTLANHKAKTGKPWKQIERDLSEILASHGEPPIYANRINRLRSGKSRPSIAEVRALVEYVGLDSYKD